MGTDQGMQEHAERVDALRQRQLELRAELEDVEAEMAEALRCTSGVSAIDVAEYMLAQMGAMTTMKLQKLVYYCQAWHLAWDGVAMFTEPIEAWANGPVVAALHELHKGHFMVAPGCLTMTREVRALPVTRTDRADGSVVLSIVHPDGDALMEVLCTPGAGTGTCTEQDVAEGVAMLEELRARWIGEEWDVMIDDAIKRFKRVLAWLGAHVTESREDGVLVLALDDADRGIHLLERAETTSEADEVTARERFDRALKHQAHLHWREDAPGVA